MAGRSCGVPPPSGTQLQAGPGPPARAHPCGDGQLLDRALPGCCRCPGSPGCARQPPASQPTAISIPLPSRAPVMPGVFFWRSGKMKRRVEARPALSPGLPTLWCCHASPETLGLCGAFICLCSPAAAFPSSCWVQTLLLLCRSYCSTSSAVPSALTSFKPSH